MDIQLHYEEYGQGEVLLLLHGNGESGEYFRNQIPYFSKKYRVIAVDTRGHGKSPRGAEPFTIRQFADDLKGFMDEKKIARAHLLGFSDGGNIAMVFALKYPSRVNRLILNGANLDGGGVKPSVQIPIIIGYGMASLCAKVSQKARANAEMLRLMVKDPNLKKEELAKIKSKTLVIAGTKDMIKEKHTRLIAGNIPDCRLVFLPGDHFIAGKNPQAFNQTVGQFLGMEKAAAIRPNRR
ncbi:MAG TPA: alpha/beta hydrolase [Candidatus Egerieimonas intestinavium]|uniref:Alpha/beta hydrolase n=1 Tax=Candidatus Egerieimonas intestinavium TaxID=2840777 RepID=A0A9D1EK44_9FIRM|nr:alpha/beta hydrolase [Candidatus Egerieimonas intestinavium]